MSYVFKSSFGGLPYYRMPNPTIAFITALQKTLGVTETGAWDRMTHDALFSWYNTWQTRNTPDDIIVTPEWAMASDPRGTGIESFENSVRLALDAIDVYIEHTPAMAMNLGWDSFEGMLGDESYPTVSEDLISELAFAMRDAEIAASGSGLSNRAPMQAKRMSKRAATIVVLGLGALIGTLAVVFLYRDRSGE